MLVLLCDGFCTLKAGVRDEKQQRAFRFFALCLRLPLVMQMILIRRVYLSPKLFFLSSQTETALGRVLHHFQAVYSR